jgi:hypothetical protein
VDFDPLAQVITPGMRARRWRDGHLEADEHHTLEETFCFRNELLMMPAQAGFGHAEPARDLDILVFIARKPPD